MNVGILGLGPVGKSFVYLGTKFAPGHNPHQLYVFDKNPERMKALGEYAHIHPCENEAEVGYNAHLLMCCTDMLNADAITKAMKEMKDGTVVSDDFSAKAPALDAYNAAGRQLPYWSIHTTFAPSSKGFKNQLVIEIPARYCRDDEGKENQYITEFRDTMINAGAHFKTIAFPSDHDKRMGRIQGSTSASNICTARTLAELDINPMKAGNDTYSNMLDKVKFQMALRAIGEKGSSNPTVYGLIAMMNPYSIGNIKGYYDALELLISEVGRGRKGVRSLLNDAVENLGPERVKKAGRLWDESFGPIDEAGNSYSSHLAEAIVWSHPKEYPLEIFHETPTSPYKMRELMALKALSMRERCISNMIEGGTHDKDFLTIVKGYRDWAERAVDAVHGSRVEGWKHLEVFEDTFFDPVRDTFPEEMVGIGEKTNELFAKIK